MVSYYNDGSSAGSIFFDSILNAINLVGTGYILASPLPGYYYSIPNQVIKIMINKPSADATPGKETIFMIFSDSTPSENIAFVRDF